VFHAWAEGGDLPTMVGAPAEEKIQLASIPIKHKKKEKSYYTYQSLKVVQRGGGGCNRLQKKSSDISKKKENAAAQYPGVAREKKAPTVIVITVAT